MSKIRTFEDLSSYSKRKEWKVLSGVTKRSCGMR